MVRRQISAVWDPVRQSAGRLQDKRTNACSRLTQRLFPPSVVVQKAATLGALAPQYLPFPSFSFINFGCFDWHVYVKKTGEIKVTKKGGELMSAQRTGYSGSGTLGSTTARTETDVGPPNSSAVEWVTPIPGRRRWDLRSHTVKPRPTHLLCLWSVGWGLKGAGKLWPC